ncbi:EF-hand domain-containing protein [Actinoalloteichus hymeniacidonis]|uniref:Ca2+-binding protein (EF-Hand superfamily) n=1 Tax=Actinoalloteichus hymeniacidonis TaxID=340345 RepID=A0AAC9HRE3_9PSEU|nr:EF-hand domain-containing protein [Actinoalloteichus hymeniacidonis]AOS63821.1 Ca2+-binding protein (EF-Hand superfamily) [Actinoalloteichus hymeniacidonis]MBB5908125.1 Ca2+-binding EF-hand superfamily protein [Actinoalloteichus hymeniacidonis]
MDTAALERVKLIFSLFDVDGSGNLESNDFELMSDRVLEAIPEAAEERKSASVASFRQWWSTLAAELDTNNDNVITFEEFAACVLSPERFEETITEFAGALTTLGDLDGDGLVTRPNFVSIMIGIGFALENINALFAALEPNEADQITVESWDIAIKDFYRPDKSDIPGDRLVPQG